ncbi:restriction endonuclease subunit S [Glaciihabitans arcticus]|uniref:Restriction endonuclease subunit S n=1 Tax=Glaciihabitans arcticus TaxID=2668039 RepID=A0A4Q9GP14_9MICO|nr:restriction endonuclease subunit S [Glaciihabitans arcticus]TBN56476.1 restriction endonuclease subunit S [Glaciihabitans arcticus]
MTYPRLALRRVATIVNGGTPTPDETNWDGPVPWATPVDIGASNGRTLSTTLRSLSVSGARSGSSVVPAGSVLLSTRAPIGYVAKATMPVAFNQGCKALVPADGTDSTFLVYALNSVSHELESMGQGSTFTELSTSALASIRVPLPPPGEQRQIAEYLDRETGKIDKLILTHERLAETLRERRMASIVLAVTRGIVPNPALQRSKYPEIGDFPFRWSESRLKHVVRSLSTGTSVNGADIDAVPGDVLVLKTSCVYTGEFDASQSKVVNPDEVDAVTCPVTVGRIIVSRMNTPNLIGAAGIVQSAAPNTYLPDRLWQIDLKCDPMFLHFWMQTAQYRNQVQIAAVGASSSMQTLAQDRFLSIRLAVPPLSEQQRIVDSLTSSVAPIAALIEKSRSTVALLRERRSALVDAAVTGIVDVKGL